MKKLKTLLLSLIMMLGIVLIPSQTVNAAGTNVAPGDRMETAPDLSVNTRYTSNTLVSDTSYYAFQLIGGKTYDFKIYSDIPIYGGSAKTIHGGSYVSKFEMLDNTGMDYSCFMIMSGSHNYLTYDKDRGCYTKTFTAPYSGYYYLYLYDTQTTNSYALDFEMRESYGTKFAAYQGNIFYQDANDDIRCANVNDELVINDFKCDGTYTYYFQNDGTAMQDRLTYHPDGEHVIYFDSNGHEVFSDFTNVKKSISGEAVNDYCFFDVYGYLYVDVVTYDKSGKYLYYANPYGVLERNGWFQFSDNVKCADGTEWAGAAGGYGYAYSDGRLKVNASATDWLGRRCYLQANGVALYE